ncbi:MULTISPECIES: FGGY-family carbohydrate kinase [Olivibacter]|jgi:sugar (pentulose or hexulose) kinase|uniref:FGGY-family carbohydrate kinase n=1 Tax=Olivibacter oleidegradans TaxID=760123 RepID=A0ABV6HR29_9SPHI|nr:MULTISPECIES: FGGY family carbohydrate kinase [Olivibacter]MDM8174332.1 FGGY family carbohydrate kinase [Olivibacter sp. 47]QEL04147.1 carbohydrate kinase [Olivibacter sp. LS-1]
MKIPVIAIFDVGKTNKKLFLFDEHYRIVFERSARFTETVDEDGDPCENLASLRLSVFDSLHEVFRKDEFEIKAINFSTYGASFVYIDESGKPLTPLYNYLKDYPQTLKDQFYKQYGGEENFALRTASPVLGSLNSGMQLYRLKHEKPSIFKQVYKALHLPQYMSFLISGKVYSDMTSIGCHTNLWDFQKSGYHEWVEQEGILDKLAPIVPADSVFQASFPGNNYAVGAGFHDSSAALIPYLVSFTKPFVLLSTGTWCISLNPFNEEPLTSEDLKADCLSYIHYQGKPVKASRLFAGYEHEQQTKRIAAHFNVSTAKFKNIAFDTHLANKLQEQTDQSAGMSPQESLAIFGKRDLGKFRTETEAYHQLMIDLVNAQKISTTLAIGASTVKRLFVDGGFGKNVIYMNLLAEAFPQVEVFAASMAQATAVGTALAIHQSWNSLPFPNDIIELKYYAPVKKVAS